MQEDAMPEIPIAGHLDNAWIQVDQTNDPGFFIRFLDTSRARALEFARNNPQIAFAHLSLESGLSVLDCGCGTGDMLGLISHLTAPGEAVGGDLSQSMIQEARKRADANPAGNLRFDVMDVQSLAFPDLYFDRVLATQLLIHVPDPRKALRELCRVTRRQGWVAISDMDWDSLLIGCRDRELGRRFTRLFSDGVRNGLVVRDCAGWLRSEGFGNIRIIPQQIVFDSWAFVREWVIEPSLSSFLAQGSMSAREAQAFVDDLESRNANGHHFAAVTSYTVMGQRT
jgi:ubiquinone/menaquinone biosynthesis C-methylase UbiE